MERTPLEEREIAHARFSGAPWYEGLDADSRAALGRLGRKIHGLVMEYVTRPGRREEILASAQDTGREFGELLAQLEVPLPDAVEAFVAHRAPLIEAAAELLKVHRAVNGRAAEAIPLVTRITDAVLPALVAAYEKRRIAEAER